MTDLQRMPDFHYVCEQTNLGERQPLKKTQRLVRWTAADWCRWKEQMRLGGGNSISLVLLTAGGSGRATLAQIHGPHLGSRATLPVSDPCGDALPQYIISDLRSEGFLACLSTLICVAAANLEASELLSHSRVSQRPSGRGRRARRKRGRWRSRLGVTSGRAGVMNSRGAAALGRDEAARVCTYVSYSRVQSNVSLASMSK